MGKDVKNPNSINILVDELLEEIFVRLPLKSILKSKTVSRRWRSILGSKKFVDLRMSLQKSRKILAAYNCDCRQKPRLLPGSQLKGDEEIVYLHCDVTLPSMTCDGLVCIPEQYGIKVLSPWTRQLGRFSYGTEQWSSAFSLGFGRDKVTGRYKVVKMEEIRLRDWIDYGSRRDPVVECSVLDVETGDWFYLSPFPYKIASGSESACVNGSIYWLNNVGDGYKILALDLHKEEFHNVKMVPVKRTTQETQISNLENHLTIAITYTCPQWKLEIWRMDKEEERRCRKTYSISLAGKGVPRDVHAGCSRRLRFLSKGILSSTTTTRGFSNIIRRRLRFVFSLQTLVLSLLGKFGSDSFDVSHSFSSSAHDIRIKIKMPYGRISDLLLTTLVVFWLPFSCF